MNPLKHWHNQAIGERVVKALQKNNFEAVYFESREKALEAILETIPDNSTLGIGGSATLREIGFIQKVQDMGFITYDHNKPGLSFEEKTAQRYQELTSDVFLSGANAITLKGELVNRDGIGNRVAAMIFGPKKVIIVAGINKVVKDLEEADQRIKMQAAPMNSKRHDSPNPCSKTGQCADCQSDSRICNITTIIHKCPPLTKIQVVLIGEVLGY